LQTGHVQISELERAEQSHAMARMIATYLAEHCVSSKDGRSYTVTQITHAMKEAAYAVHPTRSVKQQCMDCLQKIQPVLPIRRAKMELLLTYLDNDGQEQVTRFLLQQQLIPTTTKENSISVLVDPSLYRPLQELMTTVQGTCEILRQAVKEITHSTHLEGKPTIVNDTEILPLVHTLQNVTLHNENHDEDNEEDHFVPTTKRATQKKQQKLSKKAKRRDKEDAVDRQERIMTEQKRKEDREGSTIITTVVGGTSDDITKTTTKACNTCGGTFTQTAYRAHFKSDWHRYNQKLLLQGIAAVTEQEFILCDADFLAL
jgi:SBDS protein C-terminal domain